MKFQIISCNIILNLSQFLIGEITNLFVYAIPYPLPASNLKLLLDGRLRLEIVNKIDA